MNGLIENMQEMEKAKSLVTDVEVPPEIFQYIDQGRNPQLYTKDCLHKVYINPIYSGEGAYASPPWLRLPRTKNWTGPGFWHFYYNLVMDVSWKFCIV